MSSEAAQKAYPQDPDGLFIFRPALMQAFDRGAVEALRQAAAEFEEWQEHVNEHDHGLPAWLRKMADDWEVGQ